MNKKTKNMNIPVFSFICFSARTLGIRLLSSILHSKGYECNLIFLVSDVHHTTGSLFPQVQKRLLQLLDNKKTTIIGISLMSSYFKLANKITEQIKKELKIPVLWGGVHPTLEPEECIRIADIICSGEGEEAIIELATALSQDKAIDNIRNLWINRNGQIIRNLRRPLSRKLDLIPFPVYGNNNIYYLYKDKFFQGDPIPSDYPEYDIMSSRGCPYHCSYCINSRIEEIYPDARSSIRRRSPSNVIDEIIHAQKYFTKLQQIRFQDEVFAWEPKWVEEFCSLYKEKIKLAFACTFHPNVVKKEIVAMLKDAGLMSVGFGVQSASQRVRTHIFTRPVKDTTLISSAQILQRQKVDLYCDIILNNPFETKDDKLEGLNFLLKFPRPYNWAMYFLRYYPHTTLTERAIKEGIISENQVEGLGMFSYTNFADPKSNLKKEGFLWYYLLILASKSFIPRKLIKWIGTNSLFNKSPSFLKPIVWISHYINMITLGFKKLRRGYLNYSFLKLYVRQAIKPRN